MTIAIVNEYAVVIHCTLSSVAPNTFIIVGKATLTVVALSADRSVPIMTTASVDHAREASKVVSCAICPIPLPDMYADGRVCPDQQLVIALGKPDFYRDKLNRLHESAA